MSKAQENNPQKIFYIKFQLFFIFVNLSFILIDSQ